MNIEKIKISDPLYPRLLKEIPDPPDTLYFAGDINVLKKPSVAVVGTRNMTSYGESQAFRLSKDMSKQGICVVSGLAYGIDSAAHKGTLEVEGATIAVIAQGLPEIGPARNRWLAERILAKNGLILSEREAGHQVMKHEYLERNRIISGLSSGVVVVEAGERSGAVNTACHALDQNREVMAVPGRITDKQSIGANRLIKNGATPVSRLEEICECIGFSPEKIFDVTLEGMERVIFEILKRKPMTAAELGETFEGKLKELYKILGTLELRGIVRRGQDLRYGVIDRV